jgi:hypothetical protein
MPFACIFVPNFPVAAVSRAEPELRALALAIFEGKPPMEKIFAVNESAARSGITPGMTKAQAELCSELTLRPRSLLQESVAHAAPAGLRAIVFALRGRCSRRHGNS